MPKNGRVKEIRLDKRRFPTFSLAKYANKSEKPRRMTPKRRIRGSAGISVKGPEGSSGEGESALGCTDWTLVPSVFSALEPSATVLLRNIP